MKHAASPADVTVRAPAAMEAAPSAVTHRALPAVGAQAQAATAVAVGALARSLSAVAVEEVDPAAVETPQAMAWEEDTAVAVGDQVRRSLLAVAMEQEDIPDAAVGDAVVGLQDQRLSLKAEVVEVPLDTVVEDPAMT